MSKNKTLHDVLIEEIKDLYSAETQLTRALPQFVKSANDPVLKAVLAEHLMQTRQHVVRLREVADLLGVSPAGQACPAMQGLIAEGMDRLASASAGDARDASLICVTQKIEHCEIAGYGCARSFAQVLGLHQAATLLQTTLDEETAEDRELSSLAGLINSRAESPNWTLSIVS